MQKEFNTSCVINTTKVKGLYDGLYRQRYIKSKDGLLGVIIYRVRN